MGQGCQLPLTPAGPGCSSSPSPGPGPADHRPGPTEMLPGGRYSARRAPGGSTARDKQLPLPANTPCPRRRLCRGPPGPACPDAQACCPAPAIQRTRAHARAHTHAHPHKHTQRAHTQTHWPLGSTRLRPPHIPVWNYSPPHDGVGRGFRLGCNLSETLGGLALVQEGLRTPRAVGVGGSGRRASPGASCPSPEADPRPRSHGSPLPQGTQHFILQKCGHNPAQPL